MKNLPKSVPCTHPDHDIEGDCLETGVGCNPYCECCLDPFSVHTNKMQARIDELESWIRDFRQFQPPDRRAWIDKILGDES